MKVLLVASLLVLTVLAGCSAPPTGVQGPVATGTTTTTVPFAYRIDPTPTDLTASAWTATGWVQGPAKLLVVQGPSAEHMDQVSVHDGLDGDWSIVLQAEPGDGYYDFLFMRDGTTEATERVVVVRYLPVTLQVDFGVSGTTPIDDRVLVNVDARASQAAYDAAGVQHPEYANVHDVMATWESDTGHVVTYSQTQSFGSFSVEQIDGEGNPVTTEAPPWWCYRVNGVRADQGISSQRFSEGDVIAWDLGSCT